MEKQSIPGISDIRTAQRFLFALDRTASFYNIQATDILAEVNISIGIILEIRAGIFKPINREYFQRLQESRFRISKVYLLRNEGEMHLPEPPEPKPVTKLVPEPESTFSWVKPPAHQQQVARYNLPKEFVEIRQMYIIRVDIEGQHLVKTIPDLDEALVQFVILCKMAAAADRLKIDLSESVQNWEYRVFGFCQDKKSSVLMTQEFLTVQFIM
ncbi:MAG: hypothetical protein V4543_00760 [Bacteroidota bacterium]